VTAAGPSAGTKASSGPTRLALVLATAASGVLVALLLRVVLPAWRAADEAARKAAALMAAEEEVAEMRITLSAAERLTADARFAGACASAAVIGAPVPMRGSAADPRLGELLLDVLPLACAVGHALDLHHARYICGLTLREGVRRADGSLDRAGFLGGAADVIRNFSRLQGLDAIRTEKRHEFKFSIPTTQLIRASVDGDEKRARELVAAGATLDLVGSNGWSALHEASASGHLHIVKLLLDGKYEGTGADINRQSLSGVTPISLACVLGREAVVRLLLERGADATLRDNGGRTPLSSARAHNRAAIVALLKAHGAPE